MVARSVMVRPVLLACALGLGACFVDASMPTSDGVATTAGPTTDSDSATGSTGESTTSTTSTTSATSDGSTASDGSTTTPPAACGNSTIDAGEECDDGTENGPGKACKGDCSLNVCGDGDVGPAESCDDGNTANGDGCSEACTSERLYAFLSQGKINGNAGTIADVDAKCQSEAGSAGLPGKYYAWITFGPETSPASRFADHNLDVVLPGAEMPLIAKGRAGLLMPIHQGAIDRTASGVAVKTSSCGAEGGVWTGTVENGEVASDNCLGFTSADPNEVGAAGVFGSAGAGWSAACDLACSISLRFYCFQQP